MGRSGQTGGHAPTFPWLLLPARPRADIPEDLHDEQVDGEHEEGALKANHHLLPCELYLTWQGQAEKERFCLQNMRVKPEVRGFSQARGSDSFSPGGGAEDLDK